MSMKTRSGVTRRAFTAGVGATGILAAMGPYVPARAQAAPLKVGVILPRSGIGAGIGQDAYRGAEISVPILKSMGLPDIQLMSGDTESNVDTARARAEKLIADGAQVLVGAYDSGQTTVIAQVAEQKGIPLVINIAAAPDITEQGYKFVFRNFPTAPTILGDAFANQKEVFAIAGVSPKTAVFLRVNDTYGASMGGAIGAVSAKADLPYKIVDEIAYDPATKDLSVEVAKAKASNPEILLIVGRLNDAIIMTREFAKQRFTPQAIFSMGPGWYDDQYLRTLGKLSDGPISLSPWQDPNKKLTPVLEAALAKAYPDINLSTNHVFTFEALLVAADAYKRAGSADPKALADAIRKTNITDNVAIGSGISFNEKGQNAGVHNGAVQNQNGKLIPVAPKAAAAAKVVWPIKPYGERG